MNSFNNTDIEAQHQELRFRIFRTLYEQNGDVVQAIEKLDAVHNAIKGVNMVVENGVVKQTVAQAINPTKGN